MKQYHDLLQRILDEGVPTEDRTGTGTLSIFGHQMRFDLAEGFPLVTTKKIHLKSIIHELLWFIRGDTNVQSLQQHGVRIWDEWSTEQQTQRFGRSAGDLGPIYGHQWRNFGSSTDDTGCFRPDGVDQLARAVETIQRNPHSRRIIVTGWNPKEVDQVALPPCHTLFQFHVTPSRVGASATLNCQLYQRSADVFLGVPFNIASYALLTMMMAQVCQIKPGHFVHTFGDAHLYRDHLQQARLQLQRQPRPLPHMHLNPEVADLFAFTYEDFTLEGYEPHPHIKAPVSV